MCSFMDLSPNGSLLVYSAVRYGSPENRWTAISRPPYFSALVAWQVPGLFAYAGEFDTNNSVRLYGVKPESPILTGHVPASFKIRYDAAKMTAAQQFQEFRHRTGWRVHPAKHRPWEEDPDAISIETQIETKASINESYPALKWLRLPIEPLEKEFQPQDSERIRGPFLAKQGIEYELRFLTTYMKYHSIVLAHELTQTQYLLRRVDWANLDQRGRVVFTRGGVVYACHADSRGQPVVKMLADFTADRFESIPPPDSAIRW